MRRILFALLIAVVLASGCIGGNDQPETDNDDQETVDFPANDSEDQTGDNNRSDDYAGAGSNFSSADERLDYTDDAEFASNPNTPEVLATHAGFATVPPNHGGQQFEDFRVIYDYDAVSDVSASSITLLLLDVGGNSTLANPGEEDFRMDIESVEINQDGRELRIVPSNPPQDYNMTLDDRVIVEYENVMNPTEGLKTVQMEVNTAETDRVYPDPVSATLEIGT